MLTALLQTLAAFLLTAVIGQRIANRWQRRAEKEARFFEASKEMYSQMMEAADQLSDLVGRRIYASQRVCMLSATDPGYMDAVEQFRAIVIEWNEKLFRTELGIRTRFRGASLYEFERIQSELARVSNMIHAMLRSGDRSKARVIIDDLRHVRFLFFSFAQNMVKEARLLHRQMHFGVRIKYDRYEVENMSTNDLIKALGTSRVEGQSVIRSPSDFGLPVSVGDARFGIYE